MPHHNADLEPEHAVNPSTLPASRAPDFAPGAGASDDRPASAGPDSELDALREREREIMQLLGTRSPDRILHDLRNLINEVILLRALMQTDEKQ
jgi:hypothetical protein